MTSSKRSIADELCEMAGCEKLDDAVRGLGLVPDGIQFMGYDTVADWSRGGSETYIYHFEIHGDHGWQRRFVLKALIGFSPGVSLSEAATCWVQRRDLIASEGIRVPKVFGVYRAAILEEYVPFSVTDAVRRRTLQHALIFGMTSYAAALANLRFQPTASFGDLRTFGRDIVPVDFGTDLGHPGREESSVEEPLRQLIEYLDRLKIPAGPDLRGRYFDLIRDRRNLI